MSTLSFRFIETDRLRLRLLTPELYDQVMRTLPDHDLKEFFGFTTNAELQTEKERHQKGLTTYHISFAKFHLLDKLSGTVIGSCGFHTWYTVHSRAEIGYLMKDDEHKGKGFMTEALRRILQYGFEEMKLHRVEACIGPANTASIRLVERLGFKKEGFLREHYFKNGKQEDSLIYSLLKSEYKKP